MERIVAAVVVASLVNHIGCLSKVLSADWMSGSKAGSEPAQNKNRKIMKAFQDGKVEPCLYECLMFLNIISMYYGNCLLFFLSFYCLFGFVHLAEYLLTVSA